MEKVDILKYYSRPEVQDAILEYSQDREVGVRFGSGAFGKRPDILQFRGDVLEFAKRGVTSFHISEERWTDPMQIVTGMTKRQLDELRKGWDLILDIDTAFWDYAKYTAFLLIEALKVHNIKNMGIKFSVTGNTLVLIKIKEKIELMPIKKAISLFKEGNKIETLSLDKEDYFF